MQAYSAPEKFTPRKTIGTAALRLRTPAFPHLFLLFGCPELEYQEPTQRMRTDLQERKRSRPVTPRREAPGIR
jgi:hypothetical protein